MKKIMSVLCLSLTLVSSGAFAADFELDRGMGYKKGRDIESWMDSSESRSDSSRSMLSSDARFNANSSINASSVGISIYIKTEAGSHVVLNATQINKGNQTVEVTLNGADKKQYKNVETQPVENTTNTLYYQK